MTISDSIILTTFLLGILFIYLGKVKLDILDPFFNFVIFILIFFVLNMLNGYEFLPYTGILLLISLIAFFLGYITQTSVHKEKPINIVKSSNYILKFASLIIIKFSLLRLKLYVAGYTIKTYLANMLYFHSHHGKLGGYVWNVLEQPLQAAFFILCYQYINERRNAKSVLFIALVSLAMQVAGLSQSRWGYVQALFILPMVYWMVLLRKRPGLNPLVILFAPVVGALMAILNNIRNGYNWNNDFSDGTFIAIISQLAGDAEPARNFDVLLSRLSDFNYGYYLVMQFVSIIPRAVWLSKPYTSMLVNYTSQYFNIDAINDGKTLTFTFLDYYTVGGVVSLIIGMFITGRLLNFIYKKIYSGSVKYFILFVPILINLINYYRGSFMDGLLLTAVQIISYYLMLKLLLQRSYKSRNEAEV